MRLISIENFELKITPEALLIKPIRKLWNQDRSASKERFYQQMSYLFFMVDPRSSYSHLLNLSERSKAIIEQEGLPDDFKPSELLIEAMKIYKNLTVTPSQKLLVSAIKGANTVSEFLERPDILTAVDDKGRPLYQVSSITKAIADVEKIVASLQTLQKKVDQELQDESKIRGSQELTIGDVWAEQGM